MAGFGCYRSVAATLMALAYVTCPVQTPVAAGDDAVPSAERVAQAASPLLGVRAEDIGVVSVTPSTLGEQRIYDCTCATHAADGRMLEKWAVFLDQATLYVRMATPLICDENATREIAETMARALFPAWCDGMALETELQSGDITRFGWEERRDGVRTGSFVRFSVSRYRPGVPRNYVSYVATPRSLDEVKVTREQAVQKAMAEIAAKGFRGELKSAELYLDSNMRPFPHWILHLDARKEGAGPEPESLPAGFVIHAVTGEIVEPAPQRDE